LDTGRAAAAGFAINTTVSPPQIMNPLGAGVIVSRFRPWRPAMRPRRPCL
jgi:hypothetical protein